MIDACNSKTERQKKIQAAIDHGVSRKSNEEISYGTPLSFKKPELPFVAHPLKSFGLQMGVKRNLPFFIRYMTMDRILF